MALRSINPGSVSRLRLLNFGLAFALAGMVALVVSHAATAGFIYAYEQDVASKTSKLRTDRGLSGLQHIECLNTVAENWAKQMATEQKMYHNPNRTAQVEALCKGQWSAGGENVGAGYATPDTVIQAWLDSPAHYKVLYNPVYTKTGVGSYAGSNGYIYWVQVFASCSKCTSQWSTPATLATAPPVTTQSTGLSMMPGTSPSVWGDTVAFQSNSGNLWTKIIGTAGSAKDKGLGMMGGTSPSMYGNDFAFQANNTSLYRNGNYLGLGMAGGTSPDMWGDKIAFQANTGNLYINGNNQNLGMASRTSPSIYDDKVVFQANTGTLWRKNLGTGVAADQKLGMAPGSSPDIWGDTVVFAANTNTLWIKVLGGGARDIGLGIAPGTSPAIYDNKVVFQAYGTGKLWRYNISTGQGQDLGLAVAPGTSPDMWGDRIVFQAAGTNKLWQYNLANNTGGEVNP